jgi:hypothetical protein
MITRAAESRTGAKVRFTDEVSIKKAESGLWTVVDDSEAQRTRFNFYLRAVNDELDTYGIAVNRFWENRIGSGDGRLLILVDDLARVQLEQDVEGAPSLYEARYGVGDTTVSRDEPFYHVGRVVMGVSDEVVLQVDEMMQSKASLVEVRSLVPRGN